jgi:antitoxin component YwqK of YwqJK toxin-antitoxin module
MNNLNNKGEKHGDWEYYMNGELFRKCSYKNGVLHGSGVYYWDNGNSRFEGSYDEGNPTGFWKLYNVCGKLNVKEFYI